MTESMPPVVLVLAGNDPSGGAGLAADIQALVANGCYPAPVVTALTVQDTRGVTRLDAVDAELVREQARVVLQDLPVVAIKTGLLVNPEILAVVADLVDEFMLPLIADPVLASGAGQPMASDSLAQHYVQTLLPRTLLLTPNRIEAAALGAADTIDGQARLLTGTGCQWVLITGGHATGDLVDHELYDAAGSVRHFSQPRLAGEYHGSGCTLASACAAAIAHRQPVEQAVAGALEYTRRALETALALGQGQHLPNRVPR